MTHFGSSYSTPGWQRAQARGRGRFGDDGFEEEADAYSADNYGMKEASPPAHARQGADTRGKPRGPVPDAGAFQH